MTTKWAFVLLCAPGLLVPVGRLMSQQVQTTIEADAGYDDNAAISAGGGGSSLARESVVLSYNRPGERTQLYVVGVGRFSQFFDVSGLDDQSGNVTLALTHNFSSRLFFYTSVYAAYQTEPNFQTAVGPENVRAAHFETDDIFSVTYYWVSRLSTVTSYNFQRVSYDSASIGFFQDRVEGTLGEQLQFSLTSRTNLVGDYRYEVIDYDTAPLDSVTHYTLVGIDHHLTEHLILHARAGETFHSLENQGDTTNPYFEGSVDYTSSNHSLHWTTSYGFEPPTAVGVPIRKTLRTGLTLMYDLTSRLSSTTAVNYHHDENEGSISSLTGSVGSQDSIDLSLNLRYTINRRLSLHADYSHTTVGSLGSAPGYSRNSYSAGLSYTY